LIRTPGNFLVIGAASNAHLTAPRTTWHECKMAGRFAAVVVLGALGAAACGDNTFPVGPPLAPASDLTIVAHQDDDLLFLQPDLYDAVQRRGGVTNVYVTAGNSTHGWELAETRNSGLMAAYGEAAGDDNWTCGWIRLESVWAEHCRLPAARVSLVFLYYPDGGIDGSLPDSLLKLWEGKIDRAAAVARRPSTYDQPTLIQVVADIIDQTGPTTIRTLEVGSNHGYEHSDHMIVAALTILATARQPHAPELLSYRGYNMTDEPANADPALFARSAASLRRYEACATGCAACGEACPLDRIESIHRDYLMRRYAIGMRRTADGTLQLGDGCVAATAAGGNAVIGDCQTAPSWHLDGQGTLRTGELCLSTFLTGEIVVNACGDPGAAGRFFYDDEGHLWTSAVPAPEDDMDFAHLDCVGAAGGRPRAGLCGRGRAPSWVFARAMVVTPRAAAGITASGRAVRLARLAGDTAPSLCAVQAGGLQCAPTTAAGEVSPAVRIDSPIAPLAIEPESLALGDVDGDGLTDACGRDAGGILCATAATGFQAVRWTAALGASGPATAADRSLAIAADGSLCELTAAGVGCVARGQAEVTDVRSTWPDPQAALWFADLDGDGRTDWCVATPHGPACGLDADRATTRAGIDWGYALGMMIDHSAGPHPLPDTGTAGFTDIDGDGRADLCAARDGEIDCARSLRHGFAPRAPVAHLPPGMTPTSLWTEPPGGATPPRLCAADATSIACTE
jgi:LmbE family N-acetylglucosaminyl deacetylase